MRSRYRAFHKESTKIFGDRVGRITVNAGLTCPNRDGTKAKNGCTFCLDASYTGLTFKENLNIRGQIEKGWAHLEKRYRAHPFNQFLVYFQNGSNTYASVDFLRGLYEEALSVKGVVGLIISTRPDCIEPPVLDLLYEFHRRTYLEVELGLPSHLDDQNKRLNRAHTVSDFIQTTKNLHERGIKVCAHVILGLPDETDKEICEKARFVSNQPIDSIKIHNLVVFKDTVLEKMVHQGSYKTLSLEKYSTLCVDFLEHLRPDIIIQRLNAHGPRHLTVAPEWSINKWLAINAIHAELERRDTWQGKKQSKN